MQPIKRIFFQAFLHFIPPLLMNNFDNMVFIKSMKKYLVEFLNARIEL